MIKKLSLIGAAVAAAMAAAPSMALPIASANESTPGVVKLVISGSSAFQTAFELELNSGSSSICQNGTYTKYSGTVAGGTQPNQIAAYSCTSVTTLFGTAKPTIIYYRSDGGSAFGLAPTVRSGAKVYRLALTDGCVGTTCSMGTSFDPLTDTIVGVTDRAVEATTDLGLADEEANMFVGSNYPTVPKLGPELTSTELTLLNSNSSPLVLQSFGVFTHVEPAGTAGTADLALNSLPSLSREVVADIFRGKWSDWNQVPKNDGSNTTVTGANNLPIVVCRREQGSGTQVAAAVFFHNTNCGGADEFVKAVAGSSGNLDPLTQVKPQTSTGNMRSCLATNKGAIGFISAEADNASSSTNHHMIQIDGQGSSIAEIGNNLGVATASGDYGFAFELVAIKRPGLDLEALTLADKLISVSQSQTTGPVSPNVTFLPTGPNALNTQFPLVTPSGKQPVSCFSRSGNSCLELADAC